MLEILHSVSPTACAHGETPFRMTVLFFPPPHPPQTRRHRTHHRNSAAVNNAKFVIQISKGLIRDQRARRTLMFYSVIFALVLLFAGSTFLWAQLREHPFIFLIYWAGCAWITLLAVLLALYDVVKVRAEVRREKRRLERELIEKAKMEKTDDPHAR